MEGYEELTEQQLRKMESELKKKNPNKMVQRIGKVGFTISKGKIK
jgi:hypothetical protein